LAKKLTQEFVASLVPDGRDRLVFDGAMPGFGIRLTPAGKRIWIARAKCGGRRIYHPLGEFPALSLTAARKAASRALEDIRQGLDPALERRAREMAIQAGQTTVEALGERWLAEVIEPKRKPRTAADYRLLLEKKIGPSLGGHPISALTRDRVVAWHASMAGTPRRANYALAVLKALCNFAEDLGLRPPHTNPCRRIDLYREGRRERFLSEAEIGQAADGIAAAERAGRIGPHAAAGLRLALFTGARSGELLAAGWRHVDFERKIIRLPDSKTNEPRTIHLNDAALAVLKTLPRVGTYIIAGAKKNQPHRNLTRSWIVARGFAGLDDVRLHDLRHSYASLAVSRGVSLPIIGKLLGHKVPATTQRYAHLARDVVADINDSVGAAMVAAIDKRRQAANVVKMRRRKRRNG
jgi:integrase